MAPSCSSRVMSSSRAISIVSASTSSLRNCAITSAASAFSRLKSTMAAFRIPVMSLEWLIGCVVVSQAQRLAPTDRLVPGGTFSLRRPQPPADHCGGHLGVVLYQPLQLVALRRFFGAIVVGLIFDRGRGRRRLCSRRPGGCCANRRFRRALQAAVEHPQ